MTKSSDSTVMDFVVPEKRYTVAFNGVWCSVRCWWSRESKYAGTECALFEETLTRGIGGIGRCPSCLKAEKEGGVIDD